MNAPQIDNGKTPSEPFNSLDMVRLPTNTPFGNLLLAKMTLDRRIDYLNEKLKSVYRPFPNQIPSGIFPTELLQQIEGPIEETVYLIRRATDDLISLWSVLKEFSMNGKYGEEISVDCAGALKNEIDASASAHTFYESGAWLDVLNKVANAYKHSFVHLQLQMISCREPMVLTLSSTRNSAVKAPKFYEIPLVDLVVGFGKFYAEIDKWLRSWSEQNHATQG